MRRARRADVRLTRRADARSTSAPDGAPELLLPITYYVLPKNMNFCHMLDYNTIKQTTNTINVPALHISVVAASSVPNHYALPVDTDTVLTGTGTTKFSNMPRCLQLGDDRAAHTRRADRAAARHREHLLAELPTHRQRRVHTRSAPRDRRRHNMLQHIHRVLAHITHSRAHTAPSCLTEPPTATACRNTAAQRARGARTRTTTRA